jgi:hypothetical protein
MRLEDRRKMEGLILASVKRQRVGLQQERPIRLPRKAALRLMLGVAVLVWGGLIALFIYFFERLFA